MSDANEDHTDDNELLRLTAKIVASYVGNNSLGADQVPEIVRTVSTALKQIEQGDNGPDKAVGKPAVPIRRTRWGLPADYPMVAPNYAKRRSEFAKKIGLGQKRSEA